MSASSRDMELGRFLSYVLRHNPSAAAIRLDANGWADVSALLAGCGRAGKAIDRETLDRIVRENEKRRYSFNADGTRIRANQGHSVSVDVELRESKPPERLYHGTAAHVLASIRAEGIRKRSRQHVHLSADARTAIEVGNRHGKAVLLHVDSESMHRDGLGFYLSENNVWLCECVPWSYISVEEGT